MIVGVPKEIKKHEYRVAITPDGVRELRADGHRVIVETSAGDGSGFSDEDYERRDESWRFLFFFLGSQQVCNFFKGGLLLLLKFLISLNLV